MKSDKLLWCAENYTHISNMGEENEKRSGLGGGDPYQTGMTTLGKLYHACLHEHGRCVSKMYVGDGQQVGWVFLKKNPGPPDGDGEGVIETWVEVWEDPPVRTVSWSKGIHPSFKRERAPHKRHLVTHKEES